MFIFASWTGSSESESEPENDDDDLYEMFQQEISEVSLENQKPCDRNTISLVAGGEMTEYTNNEIFFVISKEILI